ncbi:hypothetical protein GCWU000342_02089 [Shuttleworthella satelles DSM 14600]|uniref:Uncharacterized protein n=1 Tax=Shuttleworthella satelles DSM 14600 TaxID=626523 RepID=C4GDB6_9FIRM|nr:hypothetical protein GCWU000342_02089 [Shuttleworthia satelles DSM 14600]
MALEPLYARIEKLSGMNEDAGGTYFPRHAPLQVRSQIKK